MGRRKKGRVFLSALMITMMIVSLLQGIRFSQSNAKGSNWENGAEVTSDGIKVSKNVVGYDADTKDFDIELTVEVNGENEDAGIVGGTITDSMSDYVDFDERTVNVFGVINGSDEEKEKLATKVRDIEREIVGDNTLVVKKINLSKGETLKIRYKLNLKDERRDGKPYPVGGKTTLSVSPDGAVIELNSPKVWESLTTRRLTIEKKWFTGVNENPKIEVNISKGDGLSQIIELDNEHLTDSISLPVYDEEGNLCKYTVTEKLIDADAGKYESKAKLLPDNKSENANTISFSFDKIGDVIPSRKIVFANSVLNTQVIKVRKTWEGESAKEVKFELFSNSDESKLLLGEGKTIETLTLTATDLAPGEINVWEGKFKTKLPFYEEGDTDYRPVFYGVAEIGDDGKRVTYHQDGLDKNGYANNVGFVKLGGSVYQVKKGLNCGCKKDPNTHYFINTKASKRNIEIRKTWDGVPGNASFGLFKKGDTQKLPYEAKYSGAGNSGIVRFENVDIADANGNIIEYEVKELDANGNILKDGDMVTLGDRKYKVTYDEYGNITNSEPIDITVNKVWADNVPVSERKSVEVALIHDDKEVATAVLNDANGWKFTFKDLPRILGGYIVKEIKINGIKIDDSFSRLYDIDEHGCPIEETSEITIKNTFTKPYECGGTKVVKLWEDGAKKQKITVTIYKKVNGKWIPGDKGNTPGKETVEKVEFGDCVQVKPGVPSPADPPQFSHETPNREALSLQAGRVHAMRDSLELTGVEPANVEATESVVLETTIGDVTLTEEEIQKILSAANLDVIQYRLGEYEVTIQRLEGNIFFIKNAGITPVPPNPNPNPNPGANPNPGPSPDPIPTPNPNPSPNPSPNPNPTPSPTPSPDPSNPTPDPQTPSVDIPNDPTPEGDTKPKKKDEGDKPKGDDPEEPIEVPGDKTPKGTKKLPKTGGTSSEYLVVLGLGLIGLGYTFKKRR